MNKQAFWVWTIALLAGLGAFSIASTVNAQLDRQVSFDEGHATYTVPERDVFLDTVGNGLTIYDYHISDMVVITWYLCTDGRVSPSIDWDYQANGGTIEVGRFVISCKLAASIIDAYKVRKPRTTAITYSQGEGSPPITREYMIPLLDIERDPGKTNRWRKFVQRQFKPTQQ